jgi:caffeoyl-CoA O-methyltransferase
MTQSANNAAKAAKTFLTPEIADYCELHCSPESETLAALAAFTAEKRRDFAVNLSGRSVGQLLKLLVGLSGAKRLLDIGTFTGYSALSLAEGAIADARVISIDANPVCKTQADAFVAQSPHGHKIELVTAFVQDWLPQQPDACFDFIFLDADKHRYPQYLTECWRLLSVGGLLVADNILWGGHVVSEHPPTRAIAVDTFNKAAIALPNATAVCLPLRDGVMLLRKSA